MSTGTGSRRSKSLRKDIRKEVEDAAQPLDVKVNASNIAKASKRDPMHCALARALMTSREIIQVRVGLKIVLVEFKDKVVRYQLKNEDTKKIQAFDEANYFQPGVYQLMPPKIKLGVGTRDHHGKGPQRHGPSGEAVMRRQATRHLWRVHDWVEAENVKS